MRRLGLRALMAVVGLSVLAFYAAAAYVVVRVGLLLWSGRPSLVTAAVAVAALTLLFGVLSYRYGTAAVVSRLDAVPLSRQRAPGVHDRLCAAMDVERPTLLLARLGEPNALALGGPRRGVLVLDQSLFALLDGPELTAIMAHELAHLASHDGLVQTVAFSALRTVVGLFVLLLTPAVLLATGLARAAAWLRGRPTTAREGTRRVQTSVSRVVVFVLVALTAVVRAHSRRREYAADDRAVETTGDPVALARALRKIHRAGETPLGLLSTLTVRSDDEDPLTRLLSTHPPLDDRVDRLLDRVDEPVERGPRRIEVR